MISKKLTIKDIARLAGVSTATVSRVLNNKPYISKEIKEKVMFIIKQTGYRPNLNAKSLASQQTFTIGVIVPNIANPYFAEITQWLEFFADKNDYDIILVDTRNNPQKEKRIFDMFRQKRVDGIIIASLLKKESEIVIYEFLKNKYPIVLIDRHFESIITDYVVNDNELGGYMATKHLIELGHKKITFLCRSLEEYAVKLRYKGYLKALQEYNLPIKEEYLIESNIPLIEGGIKGAEIFANLKSNPTAIFAANDYMAIGAMKYLKEKCYKIPQDVSIVGFDNIELSQYIEPPLTTVTQNKMEMCKIAFEILLRKIENPEKDFEQVVIPPKLIERKTTTKLKN